MMEAQEWLEIREKYNTKGKRINKLITKRSELVKDLDKGGEDGEVREMIDAIKESEKSMIEYCKFSHYEEMLWYEDYEDNNQGINKSQSIKEEQLETKIAVDPYQNK